MTPPAWRRTLALAAVIPILTGGQPVSGIAVPSDPWVDRSPHRTGMVTVNGIQLHFLDWGGRGETLVLLTGLGGSAHIFDDLAPQFTDRFRVLALTRRGHGESDRPETGYDIGTLV